MAMTCMFAPHSDLAHGTRIVLSTLACSAAILGWSASAPGQEQGQDKPLPPEVVSIKTTDDKTLTATYYPSRAGKKAAAVIILHGYNGSRADVDSLARKLQLAGSAVIAPDLRGHGDSMLGIRHVRTDDYADMIRRDLEAVKGFLMKKNNLGELNIERLGLVGVDMGASLAINWAVLDWSWPALATGKQGQDVKALVLISPEWSFKGVRISDAVVDPAVRNDIALLIISGARNAHMLAEAKRLYTALAKFHDVSNSLPIERQTLLLRTPATSLQGISLLNEKSLDVQEMVVEFVNLRLIKPALAWQMRKPPL